MVTYDPAVLQMHANKLYAQARATIISWTFLGFFAGLLLLLLIVPVLGNLPRSETLVVCALVTVISTGFGFVIGRSRSFAYKLAAQLALCQMQIEINTRTSLNKGNGTAPSSTLVPPPVAAPNNHG